MDGGMNKDEIIKLARDAGWSGIYTQWAEPTGKPDWTPVKESLTVPVTMEQIERFAALVLANNPPQSSMAWQEGYAAGCATADKDMKAMRQLAAGKCTISKVVEELGPLSLWSKDGLEREIGKAVAAEREACAKVCMAVSSDITLLGTAAECVNAIRARKENT